MGPGEYRPTPPCMQSADLKFLNVSHLVGSQGGMTTAHPFRGFGSFSDQAWSFSEMGVENLNEILL